MKGLVSAALALTRGPIARSSIQSVMIRASGLALSFVQAILAARLLGVSGLGVMSFVMAVAQVGATLSTLGLGALATREVPRHLAVGDHAAIRAAYRHSIAIVLIAATAGSMVIMLVSSVGGLAGEDYRPALKVCAFLLPLLVVTNLASGVLRGLGKVAWAQLPGDCLRPLVMTLILGGCWLATVVLSPEDFLWLACIAATAACGVVVAKSRAALRQLPVNEGASTQIPMQLVLRSLPFLGLGLTALVHGQVNTLLLGLLSTPEQAGLYQPIARLAPILFIPVEAAGMRYVPQIAQFWRLGQSERVREVTRTFTWTTSVVTLMAAALAVMLGPRFLSLFGPDYAQLEPAVWIVAIAQVINTAFGPVGMILVSIGRSRDALLGQLLGLIISLAIAAALVPPLGAMGAVYALAIAGILKNLTQYVLVVRTTGLRPGLALMPAKRREARDAGSP